MPSPDARLPYPTAMRHYSRAVAYAQSKDRKGFDAEMSVIAAIKASDALKPMIDQGVPATELISLAEAVARGRFASAQGRYGEAADFYRQAITFESKIPYQEPPYWYYPVQQSLGAALYLDGRHAEASQAFRSALVQAPNSGWALYGLAQSEDAQGHKAEAAAARQALGRAWAGDPAWLRMERL